MIWAVQWRCTAATDGPPIVSKAVSSGRLPFLAAMWTAVCPYRLAWRTRAPTALPAALSSLTAMLCRSATAAAMSGVHPSPYSPPSWCRIDIIFSLKVDVADMLRRCPLVCHALALFSMFASPAVQYSISMKHLITDIKRAELYVGKQMHCCQTQNKCRSTV